MKLHHEKRNDTDIFSVKEYRLDTSISPLLKGELGRMIKESTSKKFIIDLSEVESCDSTGLSVLLVANHAVTDVRGQLCIVAKSEKVTSLIQITRLDQVLRVSRTLDEALVTVQSGK